MPTRTQSSRRALNLSVHRRGLIALAAFVTCGSVLGSSTAIATAQDPAIPVADRSRPAENAQSADQVEDQSAQAIMPEDVPQRAEATIAELATLLPHQSSRGALERAGQETDYVLQKVQSYLTKVRQMLAGQPSVRTLQRSSAELSELLDQMRPIEEQLDDQLDGFGTSLRRIDRIAAVWGATEELAKTEDDADATILKRIGAVLGQIEETRSAVVDHRKQLLMARDKLVNPRVALGQSIEQLQARLKARLAGVFLAEHAPLWSPRIRESLQEERQTVGPQVARELSAAYGQLWRRPTQSFGVQVALFLALGLSLPWLRSRTRARAESDDRVRSAQLVFEHPWAMAVLVTVVLTVPLDPLAPRSVGPITAVFMAVATLRIIQRYLPPAMILFAWGLVILYVLDRCRDLLDTAPTLERFVFLGEMIGGLGLLIWLLRPARIASLPEERRRHPFFRLLYVGMSVGAGLVTLAILTDVAGWSDLAALLGDGVLRSGFLGFAVFVILKVVQSLTTFALVLRPLGSIRAVSNHQQFVAQWLARSLSIFAVVLWAALVCGQLGVLNPTRVLVGQVLGAGVSVGALSLSVGDVLVFALTVWFSFVLARWIQVILQEDVFSRVRTSRGVPYAVSNLARYTVICLGFLVGLSAAGVEITKLAVVAGGLGVGIGFGLQNVVNNFVSGLILLFERPIDVGDTIELADVSGTMKRIGIRASVIRTHDGAEVIVPNGMLISDKVTNWTLSDRRRRIDLNVGVEYGTPANRVIDLLVGVARTNPKVIPDPEPVAFFENFGDSSLDFKLRVWFDADASTNTFTIHSEIAVAVQQALEDAGIGVPFPQRDLHLVSVPPGIGPDSRLVEPQSAPGKQP